MAYQYDKTPLTGELSDFAGTVRLHKVDETKLEAFWNELVKEHHYLGYEGQIGARVKYVVTLGKQVVGAISFCSAAYRLGPREEYIGWSEEARLSKLQHLVANNRFLILPWIRIRNLASNILSKSLRQLREDWERQYEITPYMVETFVDRERYLGTCYVAANWTYLGVTKGYGKKGDTFVYHGQVKDIYVYIMDRSFAKEFRPDLKRLRNGREELEAMINGIPIWYPSVLKEMGITGDITDRVRQLFVVHLDRYTNYLGSRENRAHFVAMEKGLLSDLERKSIEPIAIAYEGSDKVRNLTNFMGKNKWDDIGMREEYRRDTSGVLAHEDAMITVDDSGIPKKGRNSVGVARQYCGRVGKVDNCQVGVYTGYVSPNGYGLIDYGLYMPDEWFDNSHSDLRKRCGVPKNLKFKTKNRIASEMVRNAAESGLFPAKYVGADSAYGNDSEFLDSLPEGIIYFADVKSDLKVFTERPGMAVPPYSGRGRKPFLEAPEFPSRAVKDIAEDKELPWNDVVLDIGAKGPIITNDKFLRVVEIRDGKPGKDVWLYVRRLSDGRIKYALCNEDAEASAEDLRKPALMRWSIEQCFNECKDYLGMDHYESRSWDGWHRHMLLCFIAHLFVTKLRMEFNCKPQSPLTAPYIDEPVSLDDYLDAADDLMNSRQIAHSNIFEAPASPQQVLTIGLVRKLVEATFLKTDALLEDVDYYLRTAAQAFDSHSRSVLKRAFADYYGVLIDFG
ncbi:MAG: IS701 family transposase [Defluviitaleaceae bacterium]|nr:IS701 family transposase [Defluviitaleaceae bacterium]